VDVDVTNVSIGEACVVLTKDGLLRLKRRVQDVGKNRRYESINPKYPPFVVSPREVAAEFWVVGTTFTATIKSPLETVDEGPPPKEG